MLALLSDIHANIQALDACLAHAKAQGATHFAFLGDLVGYGGDPAAVVNCVMAYAQAGAHVIKGNHDDLAVKVSGADTAQTMDESSASCTRELLNAAQRHFLAQLPMTAQTGECLLVHAGAEAPHRWHYVDDARSAGASLEAALTQPGVRLVFGGHVHHQTLYYRGAGRGLMGFTPTPGVAVPLSRARQWIATIGSVGQPRDGDTRAMYALFDTAQARLTFLRVPYDYTAAAAAVRRSGQPEFFAKRLEEGR